MAEDKFADEVMSDEELDGVAGGTVTELRELVAVMCKNSANNIIKGWASAPIINKQVATAVYNVLKEDYGIETDIDIGWWGTGINSDPNTYKEISTGRSLSHSEVLKIISGK